MALSLSISRIGLDVNLPDLATHDLLLVSTPEYPVGELTFNFEDTPRKITGIQKVAQLFLKILFTSKGSDILRPELGTSFQDIIIGSNIQLDDQETYLSVADAIKDAETQVKYITVRNNDPASILSKLDISGFDIDKDKISMYVVLTTEAGESASISIPFPELDLPIYNG